MNITLPFSIDVSHQQTEGWHVFTSAQLPGLYVASLDLETARRDVGPSIQALLMLDTGVKCTVTQQSQIGEPRGRLQ